MLLQVLFANVSCRRLSRIAGMRFSGVRSANHIFHAGG